MLTKLRFTVPVAAAGLALLLAAGCDIQPPPAYAAVRKAPAPGKARAKTKAKAPEKETVTKPATKGVAKRPIKRALRRPGRPNPHVRRRTAPADLGGVPARRPRRPRMSQFRRG